MPCLIGKGRVRASKGAGLVLAWKPCRHLFVRRGARASLARFLEFWTPKSIRRDFVDGDFTTFDNGNPGVHWFQLRDCDVNYALTLLAHAPGEPPSTHSTTHRGLAASIQALRSLKTPSIRDGIRSSIPPNGPGGLDVSLEVHASNRILSPKDESGVITTALPSSTPFISPLDPRYPTQSTLNTFITRRDLGVDPPSSSEEEDVTHEEEAQANGGEGPKGCYGAVQMPSMWPVEADALPMSQLRIE